MEHNRKSKIILVMLAQYSVVFVISSFICKREKMLSPEQPYIPLYIYSELWENYPKMKSTAEEWNDEWWRLASVHFSLKKSLNSALLYHTHSVLPPFARYLFIRTWLYDCRAWCASRGPCDRYSRFYDRAHIKRYRSNWLSIAVHAVAVALWPCGSSTNLPDTKLSIDLQIA